MGNVEWTEELVERLITLYRDRENLYNVDHPDYGDWTERAKAFSDISLDLQQIDDKINMNDVKIQIGSLYSAYMRERRRTLDSIGPYMTDFIFFDQLNFLEAYLESNSRDSSISEEFVSYTTETSDESSDDEDEAENPAKRRRLPDAHRLFREQIAQIRDVLKRKMAHIDKANKYEAFANFVINNLAKIENAVIAQSAIQQIETVLKDSIQLDTLHTALDPEANSGNIIPLPYGMSIMEIPAEIRELEDDLPTTSSHSSRIFQLADSLMDSCVELWNTEKQDILQGCMSEDDSD